MRLEGTSTRVPVFGLRPTRGCRWRVRKLPNPRISILSPERRERTMLSKIASTMTSESLRVISTTRETSSINSAFVIILLNSPVPFGEKRPVRLPALALTSGIHYFFYGQCSRGCLPLVVVQPAALFVLGQSSHAQPDFLFGFVHLDYFEVHFFPDR